MPDVSIRVNVSGADQAAQAFNSVAKSSQQFAQTTQSTVTQARVATMGFSIALLETARIARLAGPAGKEFANSLEGVVTVGFAARGAIGAYRAVVEGMPLVLRATAAATEALGVATRFLLGPWGLALVAAVALTAALVVLVRRHREAADSAEAQGRALEHAAASARLAALHDAVLNDRLRDSILLQHEHAGAIAGVTLQTQGLLGPSVALHETFRDIAQEEKDAAEEAKHLNDVWEQEHMQVVFGVRAMEGRWVALGDAAEQAARQQIRAAQDSENALADIGIQAKNAYTEVQNAANDAAIIEAQSAADAAIMAKNAWVESQNDQVDAAVDAQAKIQASVENAVAGVLTVTTQGTDIWSQLWVVAANKAIEQLALVKAASGFIGGILGGILGIFGLQHGGSFIATKPMLVPVGEDSRAERISVTPLAGAPVHGGGGNQIVLQGPMFWDEISYARFIRRVGRDLTAAPIGRVG